MSIIEWFLNFYEDARELRPVEGIVRAGEVLFVPKGWWHLALNLEVRRVPDFKNALGGRCCLKIVERCSIKEPVSADVHHI